MVFFSQNMNWLFFFPGKCYVGFSVKGLILLILHGEEEGQCCIQPIRDAQTLIELWDQL